jgi:hypothetical protein
MGIVSYWIMGAIISGSGFLIALLLGVIDLSLTNLFM